MPDKPPVLAFAEIDSTNLEARRQMDAGAAAPLWITAGRQTAGRGRRGRNWQTVEGNLAATLLLETNKPPIEAAQIAFVAALAVADLAGAYIPSSLVTLKWPNDTLIGGQKVSGILVESSTHPAGGLWLAVGIGVNLAQAPDDVEQPATSFAAHLSAASPTPLEALDILSSAMERWRGVWESAGFAPIAEAWTDRAHGLGERCVARFHAETVEGIAEGLDTDGALRLRLADGSLRRITAGDVFF